MLAPKDSGAYDWLSVAETRRRHTVAANSKPKTVIAERCLMNIPSPKEVVKTWVNAFNAADAEAISGLYHADAVNHQIAKSPAEGREPSMQCSGGSSKRR